MESLEVLIETWDERDLHTSERLGLADVVADNCSTADPAVAAECHALRNRLEEALGSLAPRLADIVRRRQGLVTGEPQTLDKIAVVHGITRDRVHQLEAKAMSQLRHPDRSGPLRDFLDEAASEPPSLVQLARRAHAHVGHERRCRLRHLNDLWEALPKPWDELRQEAAAGTLALQHRPLITQINQLLDDLK